MCQVYMVGYGLTLCAHRGRAQPEARAQVYHVGGTDPAHANVYDVNTSPGLREFSSLVRCSSG